MSSRPPRPPPAHSEAPHPRDSVCPGPAAPRLPPRPLSTEQAPLLQTRVGEPSRPGTHPHAGADGDHGLSTHSVDVAAASAAGRPVSAQPVRAAGSSACLDHGPVAVPRPRCGSPARAPQGDPRGLRASSPPPTRDRGAGPCLPGVLVAPKARPAQPGVATVRVVGGGRGDLEVSERRGPRRDAWAGGAGPSARPRGPFSLWPVPQRPGGAGSCGGSAARPSAAPLLGGLLRCWAESEAGGEQTLCPLVSGHDLGLLPLGPAPWLPAGPSDPAPPQPPRPHPDQRPQPPPGARHRPLGHPSPSRRLHTAVKRRSRPELWAAEGTGGCYGNKN